MLFSCQAAGQSTTYNVLTNSDVRPLQSRSLLMSSMSGWMKLKEASSQRESSAAGFKNQVLYPRGDKHCRALFGADGSTRATLRLKSSGWAFMPHPCRRRQALICSMNLCAGDTGIRKAPSPGIRICTWPTHLTQADNPTQHCIIAMFIVSQHCNNE